MWKGGRLVVFEGITKKKSPHASDLAVIVGLDPVERVYLEENMVYMKKMGLYTRGIAAHI